MITKSMVSVSAFVFCLGLFLATPIVAQTSTGTTRQPEVSQHHKTLFELMKDMSMEMNNMAEQMAGGAFTQEQERQMSKRMDNMSRLMRRMSSVQSRPAMKEPEMKKQMDQMRKQMDEMKRNASMKSPSK